MTIRMQAPVQPGDPAGFAQAPFIMPVIPHARPGDAEQAGSTARKKAPAKREPSLVRDAVFEVCRDGFCHVVSESYFYKTLPYYTILRHELEGIPVRPSSREVLDACVVPVCLERASLAGIPVCRWGISQGYAPMPSILYGIHYFPTASEYRVVSDNAAAKEVIRHITNMGKYPFCYQPLEENAAVHTVTAVFGRTSGADTGVAEIARAVYDLFSLPLVSLVLVRDDSGYRLSSLSQVRYTQMKAEDRAMLCAFLKGQEFL